MTNAELIKALRICATQICCDNCPRLDGYPDEESSVCATNLLSDAADAIKRLTDEVDRKDKALQAWVTTWEFADAHGEWIDEQRGRWIYAKCNLCGKVQDVRSNYCPNCGAKMDGERKDGERRTDETEGS